MSQLTTVIPVYNGEQFLEATLQSVADQTRRPDRVIIQDNCSTDGTPLIAQAFAKEGFEWCRTKSHSNSGNNFNLAMNYAAETDVLHLLTADDLIKPNFYERLLEPLENVEGHALVYSAYEVIGEDGGLVEGGDLVNPFPIIPGGQAKAISIRQFISSQSNLRTICMPAVLMKTGREHLPAKLRLEFIQCADAVFYAEITSSYKNIYEIPESLCQYRRHANSTTSLNRNRPSALIADQWLAMVTISAILGKKGASAYLWNFRQRCLLAATSRVMLQGTENITPEYRDEVVQATRAISGSCAWWLGNLAVALRAFLGQSRR
ncbi:MAG: glycosyltransferase [Verrucomicrobiota bacterium]|jgi:glycosyltransferase involved in cell wall biosynthesis|nr:glycosyltransferase [Verrucomicrobiota bacterium]